MKNEIIKSYKGFNTDLTCRGFQYEVGKEYECEDVKICKEGFHACENPIDCFSYYSPAESVFHEVEQSGTLARHDEDSKVASTKIKIGLKIDFTAMVKAAIQFIYSKTDNKKEVNENYSVSSNSGDRSVSSNSGYMSVSSNSGYRSVSSNSGDRSVSSNSGDNSVSSNSGDMSVSSNSGDMSVSSNSGDRSVSSNSGDRSVSSNSGKDSISVSWGIEGKVIGSIGTTLVCAEWKYKKAKWEKVGAKLVEVDGKKIKADTLYTLKKGKFVEVK